MWRKLAAVIASSAVIWAFTLLDTFAQSLPDLAGFVGKWGGYWGLTLPSYLYVETINESGAASVVYAWGTNQSVNTPGAVKVRAKVENGVLSWGDPVNGIGFEFKLQPDGKLHGERYNKTALQGVVTISKM
jgi:hypothetical protein